MKKFITLVLSLLLSTTAFATDYARRYPTDTALAVLTPSGGVPTGTPITGCGNNEILVTDASGNLYCDSKFTFNSVTNRMSIGSTGASVGKLEIQTEDNSDYGILLLGHAGHLGNLLSVSPQGGSQAGIAQLQILGTDGTVQWNAESTPAFQTFEWFGGPSGSNILGSVQPRFDQVSFGTDADFAAMVGIKVINTGDISLAILGLAAQTGDYLRIQDSTLGSTLKIDSNFDITLPSGSDFILSTGTGTKFGTSTSQKLSFYNSTPIVQPTGDILTAITNLGIIGSPTITAGDITLGTLAVARGGTGLGSYTQGDILVATGTTTIGSVVDVATGSVLVSGGANTVPTYSASPTITTSVTCPLLIGGTGTTSTLTLQSTSGVGVNNTDIFFKTGNNGATTAGQFHYDGTFALFGVGVIPTSFMHVNGVAPASIAGSPGTTATAITTILGATGGATSGTSSPTGGTGSLWTITGGAGGGANSVSSGTGTGGSGGAGTVAGGSGNSITISSASPTAKGGTGGLMSVNGGAGGSATNSSGAASGGNGGAISMVGGGGGTSSASTSSTGGNGGNVTITAGQAGNPSSGTPANGTAGTATLSGGSGSSFSSSSVTTGAGGSVTVGGGSGGTQSSSSGSGAGGIATFQGGSGGSGSSSGVSGNGGAVTVKGGSGGGSASGTQGNGGTLTLNGGDADTSGSPTTGGNGGNTTLRGGNSNVSLSASVTQGNAGTCTVQGGQGGGNSASASNGKAGGLTTIQGGPGGNTAAGTAGDGGGLTLAGGVCGSNSGGTNGNGGVITFRTALTTSLATCGTIDKNGRWAVGGTNTSPTGLIHIAAGSATASTAPLKLTSGTLNTTAEAGTHEYNGNHYLTNSAIRFPVGGTLFDHFASVGNVGTGEDDLYSDTLAVSTLAVNGDKVDAWYQGTFTGAAASTQELRIYFGGTKIYDSGALSIGVATDNWTAHVLVIRESSSVVRCSVSISTDFATLFPYSTYTRITGLTLSNTQVLKLTGEAAGVGAADNQVVSTLGSEKFEPAA